MNNEQQTQNNIQNTNQTMNTNAVNPNSNPNPTTSNANLINQNVNTTSSITGQAETSQNAAGDATSSSTVKSVGSASSNHDFSNVVDPSKITVGPEAIHPQIPVDDPMKPKTTPSSNTQNTSESKKNNTFSLILVFILFVGVGAFIWFMPDIREMMNSNKENPDQSNVVEEDDPSETEPTESFDTMICSQISKTYTFYSQDEKLKRYSLSEEFTTDLDNHYNRCLLLQQSEVTGFVVGCERATNQVEQIRTYDLEVLPDTFENEKSYNLDEDMNTIKQELQGQNYTCS